MEMKHRHEVVKFDRDLIREYLEERDVKYMIDKDGDFIAIFALNGCPQKAFTIFAASGLLEEVFSITLRVEPSPAMPEVDALRQVNRWNQERRWPRAYYKDHGFQLDWHIDLGVGISPALFADMCDTVIAGGHMFINELSPGGEKGLAGMEFLFRELLKKLREGG